MITIKLTNREASALQVYLCLGEDDVESDQKIFAHIADFRAGQSALKKIGRACYEAGIKEAPDGR